MALRTDLERWTAEIPERAKETSRQIALSHGQDLSVVASRELRSLSSDLLSIKHLIQRQLIVPIRPTILDRLRGLVFAVADAISTQLLDPETAAGDLLAPKPLLGIDAPFGALATLQDDAAEIADEISATRPRAEHYFNRDVKEFRKERTTDVASIEAGAVTGPQLEVKGRIVRFLSQTADALSSAVASLEPRKP